MLHVNMYANVRVTVSALPHRFRAIENLLIATAAKQVGEGLHRNG